VQTGIIGCPTGSVPPDPSGVSDDGQVDEKRGNDKTLSSNAADHFLEDDSDRRQFEAV